MLLIKVSFLKDSNSGHQLSLQQDAVSISFNSFLLRINSIFSKFVSEEMVAYRTENSAMIPRNSKINMSTGSVYFCSSYSLNCSVSLSNVRTPTKRHKINLTDSWTIGLSSVLLWDKFSFDKDKICLFTLQEEYNASFWKSSVEMIKFDRKDVIMRKIWLRVLVCGSY